MCPLDWVLKTRQANAKMGWNDLGKLATLIFSKKAKNKKKKNRKPDANLTSCFIQPPSSFSVVPSTFLSQPGKHFYRAYLGCLLQGVPGIVTLKRNNIELIIYQCFFILFEPLNSPKFKGPSPSTSVPPCFQACIFYSACMCSCFRHAFFTS
jgi:hypothetical protein